MPSINDLKNDGNTKQPFIPGIQQGETVVETNTVSNNNGPFIPHIDGGTTPQQNNVRMKGSILSMTSGKVQQREKADLSTLPEGDTPGVTMKESIEKEILGPGGVFEDYLANMTEKAKEDIEKMEAEKEIEEASKSSTDDEEKKTNKTESELELEEIEKEYASDDSDKVYKNIDVFGETDTTPVEETMVETNIKEESVDVVIDEATAVVDEAPAEESIPTEDIVIERETITLEETENELEEDELEEDTDSDKIDEAEADRYVEIIRAEVSKRIKPVSKKLDISGFKIAAKAITPNKISTEEEASIAKWALPATGITFKMRELTGANIERIRTAISGNQMTTVLQIIYDNITSPKPATMEAWAKTIAFDDFDHLFFGVYIASFANSNYVQMTCDNKDCKDKVFVTDNLPMSAMVKFKDIESEKKFKELLNSDVYNSKGLYATEIVPISNKYAFGFVLPSIYTVNIENGYIDADFRAKYESASAIAPYIDKIYYIDEENQTLTPIAYNEYPNNKAKTVKSRIISYDKIISKLSMDEVNLIRAYILKIMENGQLLSYQIPAATCPHCGKEIDAVTATATQLTFARNQLSLLVNT